MSRSLTRVRDALARQDRALDVVEFRASTRTAGEAAAAIGGVAPVGHTDVDVVIADCDLLELGELWAAAGSPNSVFKLHASDLQAVTGATIAISSADIKR